MHLQMFPSRDSIAFSRVSSLFPRRKPVRLMIIPGVQKPHWEAHCSMKAFWKGESAPGEDTPSMVTRCRRFTAERGRRHEQTARYCIPDSD